MLRVGVPLSLIPAHLGVVPGCLSPIPGRLILVPGSLLVVAASDVAVRLLLLLVGPDRSIGHVARRLRRLLLGVRRRCRLQEAALLGEGLHSGHLVCEVALLEGAAGQRQSGARVREPIGCDSRPLRAYGLVDRPSSLVFLNIPGGAGQYLGVPSD